MNFPAQGTRIELLWPIEGRFCPATIVGYDNGTRLHTLAYDDGRTEQVNLRDETWRHAAAPAPTLPPLPPLPADPAQGHASAFHVYDLSPAGALPPGPDPTDLLALGDAVPATFASDLDPFSYPLDYTALLNSLPPLPDAGPVPPPLQDLQQATQAQAQAQTTTKRGRPPKRAPRDQSQAQAANGGLPALPSVPGSSQAQAQGGSGSGGGGGAGGARIKYDDEFVTKVAREYEELKSNPNREAICQGKNPAQAIGERFGISEWTVYRHFKKATSECLIEKKPESGQKRFRNSSTGPSSAGVAPSAAPAPAAATPPYSPPPNPAPPSTSVLHNTPAAYLTAVRSQVQFQAAAQAAQAQAQSSSPFQFYAGPGTAGAAATPTLVHLPQKRASEVPPASAPALGPPAAPASSGLNVRVAQPSGGEYSGFKISVVAMEAPAPGYEIRCELPGVTSSDDVQVRAHPDGQLLLVINPTKSECPDLMQARGKSPDPVGLQPQLRTPALGLPSSSSGAAPASNPHTPDQVDQDGDGLGSPRRKRAKREEKPDRDPDSAEDQDGLGGEGESPGPEPAAAKAREVQISTPPTALAQGPLFPVKKVIYFPTKIVASSARAMVTPLGSFYLSVQRDSDFATPDQDGSGRAPF